MKKAITGALALLFFYACAHVQEPITNNCDVLPIPHSVELTSDRFAFDGDVALEIVADDEDKRILNDYLEASPLAFAGKGSKRLTLEIAAVEGITSPEGYRLESTEDDVKRMDLMKRIINSMKTLEMENYNFLDLSDTLEITMIYENRVKVVLGNELELEYKLQLQQSKAKAGDIIWF